MTLCAAATVTMTGTPEKRCASPSSRQAPAPGKHSNGKPCKLNGPGIALAPDHDDESQRRTRARAHGRGRWVIRPAVGEMFHLFVQKIAAISRQAAVGLQTEQVRGVAQSCTV